MYLPQQPSPSRNTSPLLLWQLSRQVNSMVWTAVVSTMMSIEFLTLFSNKPIHTNITKSEHLALENLRKDKDHITVTADKGVALVVMDKKRKYITKCEVHLQDNSVY